MNKKRSSGNKKPNINVDNLWRSHCV